MYDKTLSGCDMWQDLVSYVIALYDFSVLDAEDVIQNTYEALLSRSTPLERGYLLWEAKNQALKLFERRNAVKRGGVGTGKNRYPGFAVYSLDEPLKGAEKDTAEFIDLIPDQIDIRWVENLVIYREFFSLLTPRQRDIALNGKRLGRFTDYHKIISAYDNQVRGRFVNVSRRTKKGMGKVPS